MRADRTAPNCSRTTAEGAHQYDDGGEVGLQAYPVDDLGLLVEVGGPVSSGSWVLGLAVVVVVGDFAGFGFGFGFTS